MKKINYFLLLFVLMLFSFSTRVSAQSFELTMPVDEKPDNAFNLFYEMQQNTKFIQNVLSPHASTLIEYLNGLSPIEGNYKYLAGVSDADVSTGDNENFMDKVLNCRVDHANCGGQYAIWLGKSSSNYYITLFYNFNFSYNTYFSIRLQYEFDNEGNFVNKTTSYSDRLGEYYDNKFHITLGRVAYLYFNYFEGNTSYVDDENDYILRYISKGGQKYHIVQQADNLNELVYAALQELTGKFNSGGQKLSFDMSYYKNNKIIGPYFELKPSSETLFNLYSADVDLSKYSSIKITDYQYGVAFVPKVKYDDNLDLNFIIYTSVLNQQIMVNPLSMVTDKSTPQYTNSASGYTISSPFNYSYFAPTDFFKSGSNISTADCLKYVYHFFALDNTNDIIIYYNSNVFDVYEDSLSSNSGLYNNPYGSNFRLSHRDLVNSSENAKKYGSFTNFDSSNNAGNSGSGATGSSGFNSDVFSKDNVTGIISTLWAGISGIGTFISMTFAVLPSQFTQILIFAFSSVVIIYVFKLFK